MIPKSQVQSCHLLARFLGLQNKSLSFNSIIKKDRFLPYWFTAVGQEPDATCGIHNVNFYWNVWGQNCKDANCLQISLAFPNRAWRGHCRPGVGLPRVKIHLQSTPWLHLLTIASPSLQHIIANTLQLPQPAHNFFLLKIANILSFLHIFRRKGWFP